MDEADGPVVIPARGARPEKLTALPVVRCRHRTEHIVCVAGVEEPVPAESGMGDTRGGRRRAAPGFGQPCEEEHGSVEGPVWRMACRRGHGRPWNACCGAAT